MSDEQLTRISAALERMAPAPLEAPDFSVAGAFVWHVAPDRLDPVEKVNRVDLQLLHGIDRSRETPFSGARGAWENRASSKRCMARFRRKD